MFSATFANFASELTGGAVSTPLCIACGSLKTEVFWEDSRRTIRRCASCSLLFRFPQPNAEELHDEFQFKYFSRNGESTPDRLELEFESWRRPVLSQITNKIRTVKPAGKLLDVGCASGEIFEYFRDGNWELCGIEPSQAAFEKAQARFGKNSRIRLLKGYLCDLDLGSSWDVVTVLESLFYMPDPRRELAYISRLLKKDGLLVVATPGYQYQRIRQTGTLSRVLSGSWCSLTPSHLFYFSPKAIASLLANAGFRIIETVPLGSSTYGNWMARALRNTYVGGARLLRAVTAGRINLSPHVLYLCSRIESPTE